VIARFVDAEAVCEHEQDGLATAAHTHLAVTPTQTELNVLYTYMHSMIPSSQWLIGLNDGASRDPGCPASSANSKYQWVTNEDPAGVLVQSALWEPGNPGDPCGSHCAMVDPSQPLLQDTSCDTAYSFMCECDGFAPDASHYTP
jgi:hypothetical protein